MAASALWGPGTVMAAGYDGLDPGLTICGNGTKPVANWYSFYVETIDQLKEALVQVRYSATCNKTQVRKGLAKLREELSDEPR